jgi:hypothetical protein
MMVYMVYHTLAFALHLIHCIGIWSYVAASSSDRTGTTSFIDAASYLVGMKAGVYVHLYASLNGFEIWM